MRKGGCALHEDDSRGPGESPGPRPPHRDPIPAGAPRIRTRTCIATRARLPETELLRVVARGEGAALRVIPDPRRRLPGRGAWLTPTLDAWAAADKRRAFGRALRVSATADAGPVRDYLEDLGDVARGPRSKGKT